MMAPEAYVGDQIGIRSTTDTVEQVKEALGPITGIRMDNSQSDEEEQKPAQEQTSQAETPTEEEETEEEKAEREEAEAAEAEKAKAKKAMPLVPRARLNKEIRKNEELERRLAALENKGEPEPAKPAAETRPQTYCGRAKPTIDVFTADPVKYPDPYAAHAEAVGEWFADERDAKREYENRITAAAQQREEEVALFKATVPETLKRRPDYNDVVNGSEVQISKLMEKFVYESQIGPDLLLYLVEHPDEAEELVQLQNRPRATAAAMFALEATLMEEFGIADDDDDEEVIPPPKKAATPPPKKSVSKAPLPASRIKSVGPQPKSLQDLAGTTDRESGRVEYNPAYTAAVKARRGT